MTYLLSLALALCGWARAAAVQRPVETPLCVTAAPGQTALPALPPAIDENAFLLRAIDLAAQSKSQRARFGAVVIDETGKIIGEGWNRQSTRAERKAIGVGIIIHAEQVAVAQALKNASKAFDGTRPTLDGARLYVAGISKDGRYYYQKIKPAVACDICARTLDRFHVDVMSSSRNGFVRVPWDKLVELTKGGKKWWQNAEKGKRQDPNIRQLPVADLRDRQALIVPRDSDQRDLLEKTFAQAARGRNTTMRFGSVLLDPKSKEVLGASWNRRSQDGETKGYHKEDWQDRLSGFAKSLIEMGRLHAGHISLTNSVHAEQGAVLEALKATGRKSLEGLRLHTIGVTPDLKIGVAKALEWTCIRCATWIDLFRPQIYELFPGRFKSFGTPKSILATAVKNHAAKDEGYWDRVSQDGVKKEEPDVYSWVKPRELIESKVSSIVLPDSQATYFSRAYSLARGVPAQKGLRTRVMSFGSVLVDPASGKIIATGDSRGGRSSEQAAIEKAIKSLGRDKLRGLQLYTVGTDPDGWVAVAEDGDATCFGCAEYAKLGVVFHELLPAGFRAVDLAATARRLGKGRFSARYWRTIDDSDERVTSPFRYHWLAPGRIQ